ncbi:helix-turn-helix transcriptional regulator [Occultella gossypii]|uniref:Helix-turn-helix transcriptional regulator n=1 Tax=Occultella gossypii TaxID=2800820 RepID=A0ABS7SBQ5_9MICO|nr:helix-turn-helix transcriptional regulator [Occultella gossypii]MBZ2197308.1 helix-turn-helix transcriptional regulator [Occultella gossypii]
MAGTGPGPGPAELTDYESHVLASWTDTHKKSALMLLILLALVEGPGWSAQVRDFISGATGGRLAVDEQSLHRALRRVEGLNLITHAAQPAPGTGAKRKVYELTASGGRVLSAYLDGPLGYLSSPDYLGAVAVLRSTATAPSVPERGVAQGVSPVG